jgi:hypothetical protein
VPRKKVVAPASAPPATVPYVPPPPPPVSPLIREAVEEIHRGLRHRLGVLFFKYGATENNLETRHWEAYDRVLDATSIEEAEHLAKKAEDKIFVTLLVLTSAGKIVAKTPEAYKKKSDKAESFANYLYSQYTEMTATTEKEVAQRAKLLLRYNSQLARSRNLREYARLLEDDPTIQPFEVLYGAKEVEDDARDEALAAAGASPVVGGSDKPKRPRGRGKVQEADDPVRVPAAQARVPGPSKAAVRLVRGAVAAKKRGRHAKNERGLRPRRASHQGR